MADEKTWEGLFQNAMRLVDEIQARGTKHLYWTFGGGTALMRKYHHRLSKLVRGGHRSEECARPGVHP